MNTINAREIENVAKQTGRQFYDLSNDVLFMNWSGCAVEFDFAGSIISADFIAMAGIEYNGIPTDPNVTTHLNWPWIAVYVDGELSFKQEIGREAMSVLIYKNCGDCKEHHTIKIVKLTENLKTQLGIKCLEFDGEVKSVKEDKKKRIEFIGDSITCGFGNMTDERDRWFYTMDEDATNSHGPLAAEKLDMDYSLVSISGICATASTGIPMEYAMEDLYLYTDKVVQDKLADCCGITEENRKMQDKFASEGKYEKFDFEKKHNDYVVLNLGTNDATGISFALKQAEEYEHFKIGYRKLVETIRQANGSNTHIICALGTMNYYLWSDIKEIVELYKRESGDKNISCYRYMQIVPVDGLGACGHPSAVTQSKMADEIANEIRRIEKQ